MKEQFLKNRSKQELIKIASSLGITGAFKKPINKLISLLMKYTYKELKQALNES